MNQVRPSGVQMCSSAAHLAVKMLKRAKIRVAAVYSRMHQVRRPKEPLAGKRCF